MCLILVISSRYPQMNALYASGLSELDVQDYKVDLARPR